MGIVFAPEITTLLFERGNFGSQDTQVTAFVLMAYLLGLLPFGLQKLLSLWLYAKFKQKIAAIIAFKALGISEYSFQYSHWDAVKSLDTWMKEQKIPGIYGVDTREITKILRDNGSMLGQIIPEGEVAENRTIDRKSTRLNSSH